jgi:hypothetical protein
MAGGSGGDGLAQEAHFGEDGGQMRTFLVGDRHQRSPDVGGLEDAEDA